MKKFKARPGQVDFTKVRWVPVINCVVCYRGKILLVQRSKELRYFPGYWNGISGFLDDQQSLEQKVQDELREEVGISAKKIKRILAGQVIHQESKKYKKSYLVVPVLVKVNTAEVRLDWEAQDYKWVTVPQAMKMRLLPGFGQLLQQLKPLIAA